MTIVLKMLALLLLLAGCLSLAFGTVGIDTELAEWLHGRHLERLAGGMALLVLGGTVLGIAADRDFKGQ